MTSEPERPFDEPWQARAFALGEALVESAGGDRKRLQAHLTRAIADQPDHAYWDCYLDAVDELAAELGVRRMAAEA